MMKIAIGADHAGYKMKEAIKAAYPNIEWIDVGTDSEESCDFPDYAFTVAMAVAGGHAERGMLVCTNGIGMTIAANRHPMIRAALCIDADMAKFGRSHSDANVLCMGAKYMDMNGAKEIIDTFLNTPFTSNMDRYVRRVRKLSLQDDGCGAGECGDHDDHGHGGGCCGGGCH